MTKEIENRYLILYSILEQNGKATKQQVLDFLLSKELIILTDEDREILQSRKEEKWRNELAFVRQHLVKENYLNNAEKNYWEITQNGIEYFNSLKSVLLQTRRVRIADYNIIVNANLSQKQLINSEAANELFSDNLELKNETIERKIVLIKRYQAIIKELKNKYKSKCQIRDCQFTFIKANGESYSECHHLKPLSQGGSQNEDNVVILCANHHRMMHFADTTIFDKVVNLRKIMINGEVKFIEYK